MSQSTKENTWFNEVLSSLPDDKVQVDILNTLNKSATGNVLVRDLVSPPKIGKDRGVKTLHKMLRNGLVRVDDTGQVSITGFGRRSIGAK